MAEGAVKCHTTFRVGALLSVYDGTVIYLFVVCPMHVHIQANPYDVKVSLHAPASFLSYVHIFVATSTPLTFFLKMAKPVDRGSSATLSGDLMSRRKVVKIYVGYFYYLGLSRGRGRL